MRTKNTLKTFLYGIFFTSIIAILGLVKTRILLSCLGDEYVGIYQLFYQIYLYLSIVDGGIGASVTYQLYNPVNSNDTKKINRIIEGSRRYFSKIGIFVILLGILISFEIMFFIKETTINVLYIKICFILYIISSAISYFTISHALLYESEQKLYKSSNLNHMLSIVESIVAIIVALLGGKLLTILICFVVLSFVKNVILVVQSRKDHKYLEKTNNPDFSFKKDANSLLVNKVNTLVFENSNVLIVSKFLGLKFVIIYNAYNQIVTMIKLMIQRLSSALLPSVGNLLVSEKEKAKKVFVELNSLLFYLANVLVVPIFFMLTPFIGLWYGADYESTKLVCLLFSLLLYIEIIRISLETYVKASGEFKEIKNCGIYQSVVCLTLSLILVHKFGIMGILFSTIFAFVTGTFAQYPRIICKKIINDKIESYYLKCAKYLLGLVLSFGIICFLDSVISISSLMTWALKGFILLIVNLIVTSAYYFLTKELYFLERFKFLLNKRKRNLKENH